MLKKFPFDSNLKKKMFSDKSNDAFLNQNDTKISNFSKILKKLMFPNYKQPFMKKSKKLENSEFKIKFSDKKGINNSKQSEIENKQKVNSLIWDDEKQKFKRESNIMRKGINLDLLTQGTLMLFSRKIGPILKRPLINLTRISQEFEASQFFFFKKKM